MQTRSFSGSKRGQNARLAAHLTGYKIDIKSESDMAALEADAELAEKAEVSIETTEE